MHGSACVAPLQLAAPPGSQVYRIPQGNLRRKIPYGTCVSLRNTTRVPSLLDIRYGAVLVLLGMNVFFLHIDNFFSSGRGSFLVLSAPGHAGSPPERHRIFPSSHYIYYIYYMLYMNGAFISDRW